MEWKPGDRVLAKCPDEPFCYPATVQRTEGDRAVVKFDEGSEYLLEADAVRPMQVNVGMRAEARFEGGPTYYGGTITLRDGDKVHIQYDDGDQEWANIGLC